jgi:hypothetical protein
VRARNGTSSGRVAPWGQGERPGALGYALVSDVDPKELDALAAQFVPST